MKNIVNFKFFIIITLFLASATIPVYALSENVPEWIKKIAEFWAKDQISDKEYIDSIKYLIDKKIINLETEEPEKFLKISGELFDIFYEKNSLSQPAKKQGYTIITSPIYFQLNPEKLDIYEKIKSDGDSIVIIPTYTDAAYSKNGFYEYFNGQCNEKCLTVSYSDKIALDYNSSVTGATILSLLGYSVITDSDLDKDPSLLKNFKKIILLHNEYVTKEMFDAITSHPKVVYLYPNALYAELKTDHTNNTITLIRGHAYPEQSIDNGFDWKYDNTRPFESDVQCKDWKFKEINNGIMLNCYPEWIIYRDFQLLKEIRDF